MHIAGTRSSDAFSPLERITLLGAGEGTLSVKDSLGREYVRQAAQPELQFTVGGAPGYHAITVEDAVGHTIERLVFPVEAHTQLSDEGGRFSDLLQMLFFTLIMPEGGEAGHVRIDGKIYRFFVRWLRDHTHTLKGMKYFDDDLKSGIELYRDTQRADGMIWDNIYPRDPEPNFWDSRFAEGDFIRPVENRTYELKRIPVENDVEYLYVEGLYYTWKAVGDDSWLVGMLDAAIKALEYSVTSPYRWSTTYQLLKRGYTIDTWDFQDEADTKVVANDPMRIDPEKTHFGVFYGDNTGYIAACHYLAEMLERVGRVEEAQTYRKRGAEMKQRLDALSWNGRFYTHHVPEHPERKRDLGVDEASQVSLSNAYSLNRGLTQEQCAAIIRTYQGIKAQLPAGSPGEWYTIYPPFEKGFGGHNGKWQYMNASVTPIVAGELAHGAFEHGFEDYGVDILLRLSELGKRFNHRFHCTYTGAISPAPERSFTPLDISPLANVDSSGTGAEGVPGWSGKGEDDLHEMPAGKQEFVGIPFTIPDPVNNGRRACIGLSSRPGYATRVEREVHAPARSIYFLHTMAGGTLAGWITLHYADGTSFTEYVLRGSNIQGFWQPTATSNDKARVAWYGNNKLTQNVGVMVYGLDNPHPQREIERITCTSSEDGSFWAIFGITLSDQAVYFPPSPISHGIPDNWGVAAVVYALIEGLVGVVDNDVAYKHATLAPRWPAAQVEQASATVTYPASRGYVAYNYNHRPASKTISIELTGSGERCDCHILLPSGVEQVLNVSENGHSLDFTTTNVEQSQYVDFAVPLPAPRTVEITYA